MAIIDVVKCVMGNRELVSRFPSQDLRLGTQLVVYPGQVAFFLKGGRVFDSFGPGTYTLETNNIPLLGKLLNLPFGGNSPFQAEVWFVNMVAILDSKWGTSTPLQIEDPKYEVIVPVRAYGQYGFSISEPEKFLAGVVGNMTVFTVDTLGQYFKGKILSMLTNIISDKLTKDGISVLKINSHLYDIAEYCKERIGERFTKYGVELREFDIIAINVKEDDPSFQKLKEAKDLAARLKITGRDVYQMERSFDVLEGAANNNGAAGAITGAGVGVGMGMGMAGQMGGMQQVMNTNPQPAVPPIPQEPQYYVAVGGQQQGPVGASQLQAAVRQGSYTRDTLAWKAGMAQWAKLGDLPEFASLFVAPPPINGGMPPVPPQTPPAL